MITYAQFLQKGGGIKKFQMPATTLNFTMNSGLQTSRASAIKRLGEASLDKAYSIDELKKLGAVQVGDKYYIKDASGKLYYIEANGIKNGYDPNKISWKYDSKLKVDDNLWRSLGGLVSNGKRYSLNSDGTYSIDGDTSGTRFGKILGLDGNAILLGNTRSSATWNSNTGTWEEKGYLYGPGRNGGVKWYHIGHQDTGPYYDEANKTYYNIDNNGNLTTSTDQLNWSQVSDLSSVGSNIWDGLGYVSVKGKDGNMSYFKPTDINKGLYSKYGDSKTLYGLRLGDSGLMLFVSSINPGAEWNSLEGRWQTTTNTTGTTNGLNMSKTVYDRAWYNNLDAAGRFNLDRQSILYGQPNHGYTITGELNDGLDADWSELDDLNWNSYLNTDEGKYWSLTHNAENGEGVKLTNQQLVDNYDKFGSFYTDEMKTARQNFLDGLTAYNTALKNWNLDGTSYNDYTSYKTAVDAKNKSILELNKLATLAATDKWNAVDGSAGSRLGNLSSISGRYTSNRERRAFDNLGRLANGTLKYSDVSTRDLRGMQRMLRRGKADSSIYGDQGAKNFYGGAKPVLQETVTAAPDAQKVDENATSYRNGGLLTYADYLSR